MPRIADFVVIQDHGITIPHDNLNDFHFDPFNAPGVAGTPSVLAFRLKSTGSPMLTILLNDVALVSNLKLEPGPERSWHETITQTQLKVTENHLDMGLNGEGSVTVSDIVVFYQAAI